jgi:heme-degrading monooxygenase HmoA
VAHVLIEHHVRDFAAFAKLFQDDAGRRERMGCRGGVVYRVAADSRDLIVLLEWDTVEHAREFAGSLELEEAMEWAASHISTPRVTVLETALESSR